MTAFSLSAQTTQIGSWKADEFTTTYTEKTWDFSESMSVLTEKSGTYNIVLTYTGGKHKLCLKEAVIKADGKEVFAAADERSAGSKPKSISYTFELGTVPKKLTLTAKARTDGGTNSNGKIELTVTDIFGGVLTIPEGTTEINSKAYYRNTDIKKAIIPNTVTKIGDLAFSHCENLSEINIPLSVTTIGKEVFSSAALTEITIPPTVTKIGEKIFLNCFELSSIIVRRNSYAHKFFKDDPKIEAIDRIEPPPFSEGDTMTTALGDTLENGILYIKEGTTQIPAKAYLGNPYFRKVVIPDTVTKIGEQAFDSCPNLAEIDIPSSVTTIGKAAFQNCLWLTTVTLHEGLTELSNKLFKNTGIAEIVIPSTVKTIGEEVFASTPLAEITIPPNVMTISEKAFSDCILTAIKVTKDSRAQILLKDNPALAVSGEHRQPPQFSKRGTFTTDLGDTIENGILYIKEGTTQIKDKAYYGNLDFQKVVIPSTVTKIGDQSFCGCENLVEIDIPSSVTTIGKEAFVNCIWLSKVTLHEGLTKLAYRAFKNTGIESLVIPATVTQIDDYAFSGCFALTEIEVPSSVREFGKELFNDCKSLTAIRVDKYSEAHAALSRYERITFTNAKPTKTEEEWRETTKYAIMEDGVLYIPKGVKKIPNARYKNTNTLREIRFSDTVERIGANAFEGCRGLKKIVIPGNVKTIADGAFAACTNLEEVVFEEGVEHILVYSFYACQKIKSVTLPLSLKTVVWDNGLFWYNHGGCVFHCYLGSTSYNLAVKNGCKKIDVVGIDEKHIDNIDMKHLNLSGNKTVKPGLFQDLPIKEIYLNSSINEIGKNAFNEKTNLRVKQDSYANHWALTNGYYIYDVAGDEFFYTKDKTTQAAKDFNISSKITELGQFVDGATLRVKQNTYGDKWAKSNGYYLSGVLGDLNIYTEDKSKEIKEDFTRILCDDDPYWRWTKYNFSLKHPLKVENIHGELVLTSFMLHPCKNVTVTDKDGKTLIKNKTIQPLTRTVLNKDFDFLSDSTDNYTVTTDDEIFKRITNLNVDWNVHFLGMYLWPVNNRPVHLRLWIKAIYNMAYIFGLPEYERRCYEAVENKTLVTNNALTKYLTKEEMERLLKKTKKFSFWLGKCRDGFGVCGGATIYLDNAFLNACGLGMPTAFWHEFSHGMGWGEQHGNMCNDGRPKPFNEDWPSIGSKLYREEFKKGNCPYNEGASFLDPWFFSREYMNQPNPEKHVIKDGVLYIGDRSPYTDSFKNKTDFTKVVIPSSVGSINGSAFYGTAIKEFTIPPSVVVIGDSAFQGCSDLRYIEIPDNVRELGDGSFQNCPQLSEAKIGKGLRKLNQKLFKGSGLKEITVPKNIRLIDNETFQDCKYLKKVVIEDGVRKIGDNAFGNTALTEITLPDSVTMFGKNITSKSVVWNVKPGTAAYEYAKENKYKIKLPQEDMNMIAAKLLAECKNAVEAPADKWDTDTIAAYDDRRKWDFSSSLKGSGEYIVTFTYTGGKSGLMLIDTLVAADGKVAAYFPESRFAGTSSKQIIYSFNVPSGTKKLEMYSFAKRDGGKSSSGNVSVRSVADYSAKILSECADSEPLSSDGWENGAFTQDDVRRRWDFSDKINGTNGGDYIIRFSYIEGSDTLRLTDSLFIADGKIIKYVPEMKSVGSNSSDAAFNITVPKDTKKIEMLSLARAGKSDNSGIISVLMEDDGTLEGITARIMAENANPKSAPTDKWDKDTFSTKNVRRKWDFSSALKGGGDYVVSFTYTSGNKSLCLSDSLFLADGKPLAHYSARQVAGKDTVNIVFRLNVPKGTKKLELYANAKKDGKGDTGGIVSVETMDNKAKKVLAEGKKYKRGPLEWDKNYFADEYVYYKWDITTLMMKDNEYSDTYMSGDYSLIFSSGVNLADVMVFADDKMISYHPDVRKFTNNTSAPYDITVPDGTKKLELYGLIKGSAAGKVTMEKGE